VSISRKTVLPEIVPIKKPTTEHQTEILRQLLNFNAGIVGSAALKSFAILLQNPASKAIEGGLWGESSYHWLYIQMLVVSGKYRERGLGSALMKKAETIARSRGYLGIRVETFSFQAPGFYEKLGYKPFGTLSNYPRGHRTIYYFKALSTKQRTATCAPTGFHQAEKKPNRFRT
jgi:GNAT superfamily N-acetyltransferase